MDMIEILKVIVLGIVEGLTEWLPISSTGHMILVDELILLETSAEFKEMFFVVIQLGAILAVVWLYFDKLNPFSKRKKEKHRILTFQLWLKILIACVPAGVLGILFDDWLDEHLYNGFIVALMLIIYGIAFIVIEKYKKDAPFKVEKLSKLSYQTAFYIGMFQVLSLVPGTSRSGATILGAMILGCARPVASEFSFFLAIPVMFGASFIKLVKFGFGFNILEITYLLLGMITAFWVSIYAIRFLMRWVKKHDFVFFGIYRIVLGMIVLIWYILSSIVAG